MELVYQDSDVLVCMKPAGMPTAPLVAGQGNSLLESVAADFPEVLAVQGKKTVEGGLVHRIDTATTGLVLIARNQAAWDHINVEQEQGRFEKTYTAFCYRHEPLSGVQYPENISPVSVQSLFRPYGKGNKGVKPVFEGSGRADRKKAGSRQYVTEIISVEDLESGNQVQLVKVRARINAGYRHQVRAHLASIGLPVLGDPLYPAIWNTEQCPAATEIPMYFFASGVSVGLSSGKHLTVEMPESFLFPLPDRMTP